MKILITNIVSLNTGDAAILRGMILVLKRAFGNEIEIIIYDRNPQDARKYYPDLVFKEWLYQEVNKVPNVRYMGRIIKKLNSVRFRLCVFFATKGFTYLSNSLFRNSEREIFKDYKDADLIVSTGGTYLVENYSLKPRLFDYQFCLRLNKPLIFFTQSLGPFNNQYNKESLKVIFERALLVLLRDERSKKNVKNLGLKGENAYVTADAAFALANVEAIEIAKMKETKKENFKIAISVREWKHFKKISETEGIANYSNSICSACMHLIDEYGASITFISTCQGIPEYWTDDSVFAQSIIDKMPEKYKKFINLNNSFHTPEELMQVLGDFDLVISTRLHMAILSMGMGIPVIPISYEFKTRELFNNLNQSDFINDIEELKPELINKSIDLFISQFPDFKNDLFNAVLFEKERAIETAKLINETYNKYKSKTME